MKSVIHLLLSLSLCAGAALRPVQSADQTLTPLEGRPQAPEFELENTNGEPVRLSDFRGKPLIVNFWATWCPPCRAEMPSMQRAWGQVQAEGIGLIAINVGEDAETIAQFTSEYPVAFPLPMDTDSKVVQAWPVKGLPTTFVVDPEGRLAYQAEGEREWDDPALLNLVRALKSEK
jgi:peroxiredoxin